MKKSIFLVLFLMSTNLFIGQSIFDKFEEHEDVRSVLVNKKMFQMMANVKVDANDKAAQQYIGLIKKLDELKVFTTSNTKNAFEMRQLAETYSKSKYLILLDNTIKDKNLQIWYQKGTNQGEEINEILMFDDGINQAKETILLSLKGDFNWNEISILVDKMKISGAEDFKKAILEKL